jgi:hypothetical protein
MPPMGGVVHPGIGVGDFDPQPAMSAGVPEHTGAIMAYPSYQAASPPLQQRPPRPLVLVPFDRRETMSIGAYAAQKGCSAPSAREEVHLQGLGRKISGRWLVSKIAAAMFLDGDREALRAYHAGDRSSSEVQGYYTRFGIDPASLGREVSAP